MPQSWKTIDEIQFNEDRWLIKNLIPREGITILASVSGEGKSLVAGHLSRCITEGLALFGNQTMKTDAHKVLYCNLEMSVSEMQRRGRLIGFNSDNKNLIILNEDDFNLNGAGLDDYKYRWLLDFIAREKIEVLIIDTFRPTTGGIPEEKAELIRRFFQKFMILKNCGVSVIFIEHVRKPTQLEGKIPKKEQVPYAYKIILEERRAFATYITGLKEKQKVLLGTLEHKKGVVNKGKEATFVTSSPNWLRG